MIFDILFVVFLGVGFWWGYQKGIIYSLFSLVAYFIGVIVALKFSFFAVSFLQSSLKLGPKAISLLSFILVFIITIALVRLVAYILESILQSFSLNFVNKIIGGLIHSLIGLYILCVLIWFLNKYDLFQEGQKRSSHTFSYINNLAPTVVEMSGKIVPVFKNSFQQYEDLLKKSYDEYQDHNKIEQS